MIQAEMTNRGKENINMMLPEPTKRVMKPSRYVSKFPGRVESEIFELGVAKRMHATMGLPNGYCKTTPDTYLRKGNGLSLKKESQSQTLHKKKMKIKAKLPSKEDKPVMGLFTDQNYITKNAVDVILAKPKQQQNSMLWTQKTGFGRVPKYLTKLRNELEEEKNQSHQVNAQEIDGAVKLSLDARHELLCHLKKKWANVNQAYQKLTFTLDTPAKKKRKETYEALLSQIEKDVQTLSKSKDIIIINDMN